MFAGDELMAVLSWLSGNGSNARAQLSDQVVGGREPVDAHPVPTRRQAYESCRRVVHLVAAVHVERPLRGDARAKRAGVEMPIRSGAELLCVLAQARRRVLFRIDRNRNQVDRVACRAELALQL